jgi:hydrogenase maturation protein HypF
VQTVRQEVTINGIVQGVGFRPFVYRLAQRHRLTGFVANTTHGVAIEVEGTPAALQSFLQDLETAPPPLAVVDRIIARSIASGADTSFTIYSSRTAGAVATQISPDVAVCTDCLAELFDPGDRRYHYPFINCTNCGPRYTIIENIPYDRPSTSMRSFTMCAECLAEYNDPAGRRFHAQPNCCPVCGPQVTLRTPARELARTGDALRTAQDLLRQGCILAIKGLGGFHLAVDATNEAAVARLRQRKERAEKPFALMVGNLAIAERICILQTADSDLLASPRSPIVLAPKKTEHGLAAAIAPGNDLFGIMLPSTPLHHLLFAGGPDVLVMTSGNRSEEPICIDNQEARQRLGTIADGFLDHDRAIYLRNDDAIVINLAGETRLIRRSRGYAPQPLRVNGTGPPLLAVGGELKNCVCLLQEDRAILSQHIGDLKNMEAYQGFQKTIGHLLLVFDAKPEIVVHDLHPQYLSTQWALEQEAVPKLAVQHHHAHLAACLAENRAAGPAIGLIMDGTGYGTDATIWGGEILIGDLSGYRRFGHFEPLPLPGGDAAVQEPWRAAVAWLAVTYGSRLPDLPFLQEFDIEPILEITAKKINTPLTSSCGRLFDVVAAMSGGRTSVTYEAQAAIEFMQAAGGQLDRAYPYDIVAGDNAMLQIATGSILRSVVDGMRKGETLATVSRRFHQTLIGLFTEITLRASLETGIKTVVISGGVFQNQLLFANLVPALEQAGLRILTHSRTPTNDGCIALGQAMIGRYHLQNKERECC